MLKIKKRLPKKIGYLGWVEVWVGKPKPKPNTQKKRVPMPGFKVLSPEEDLLVETGREF